MTAAGSDRRKTWSDIKSMSEHNLNLVPRTDPRDAHIFRWPLQPAIDAGFLLDMGGALRLFGLPSRGFISANAWAEFAEGERFDPAHSGLTIVALSYALAVSGDTPAIRCPDGFRFVRVPCVAGTRDFILMRATVFRPFNADRILVFTLGQLLPAN